VHVPERGLLGGLGGDCGPAAATAAAVEREDRLASSGIVYGRVSLGVDRTGVPVTVDVVLAV
jgi:hypothetical protein